MPGTITFKPIEANLTHNTDLLGKMNPYCAFIVGDSIFKGQICKHGGKHPHWNDAVTIPYTNQSQVIVELMDKDRFSRDDNIGSFLLNLNELQTTGQSARWYPLTYKNKPAGEILLETHFSGDVGFGQGQSGFNQGGFVESGMTQGNLSQGNLIKEEIVTVEQPVVVEQEIITRTEVPVEERHLFTEQQQIVEPRTFLKEVDVVETRAHLENIEVLEPQRVVKEVQYTQAVPVTKQIEVVEPQVVVKEVEVIEPRLVTKTIQVVENVPVKKQVEVIESVPRMQEVQTFEPQTFTKQVEVTDYVPVQKQVTVTEPVHLKKAVEFVEPVITTKTITKELAQPVIVDEKITTTVGPASVIAESEIYTTEFAKLGITESQRMERYHEWRRLRETGMNDQQLESHWQTQGWGPIQYYRFHELGHGSHHTGSHHTGSSFWGNQYGFNENQRMDRFSEWRRLRETGYNDQQLENHWQTQGWGPVSNYRFHELTSGNLHGSHHHHSSLGQKMI